MAYRFQRYLGTNYVPSIEEINDIKGVLDASARDIQYLDVEIDQLEQQLQSLQGKRSEAQDFVEQHRALISPARRLGQDILEQIFLACLPTDHNPCMTAIEAPILLTHICSSWRRIAHSTPRLWAAIHVVLPHIHLESLNMPDTSLSYLENLVEVRLRQYFVAAREWLDRARACPLSISMYQSPSMHGADTGKHRYVEMRMELIQAQFIINVFVPYSERLYEIDVYLSNTALDGLFNLGGLKAERTQMLRKFHVTVREGPSSDDNKAYFDWKFITGFLSLPLTCATLHGLEASIQDMYQTPRLAWNHFRELNLDTSVLNHCRATFVSILLRSCESLQTLKLDIFPNESSEPDRALWNDEDIEPLVLPHLTSLSLVAAVSSETYAFADHLSLPSLKHLEIMLCGPPEDDDDDTTIPEIMSALLHNYKDDLESLGIYMRTSLEDGDLVEILRGTRNLKCLKMSSSPLHYLNNRWEQSYEEGFAPLEDVIHDTILFALSTTGKAYSNIICPKLEVLDFDPGIVSDITSSTLKRFIRERNQAHLLDQRIAPLRHVSIFINEFRDQAGGSVNKMPLEGDSKVYFRDVPKLRLSPWEGLQHWWEGKRLVPKETLIPYKFYTEL